MEKRTPSGEFTFPRGVACGVPKLLDPPPTCPLRRAATETSEQRTLIHLDFFDHHQPIEFSASFSRLSRAAQFLFPAAISS
jgi:hypothetical protein